MLKKISGVVALAGMCALCLFILSCGSSSSRPSGTLYVLTQGSAGYGNNVSSFAMNLDTGGLELVNSNASTCPTAASQTTPEPCGLPLDILLDPTGATAFVLNQGTPCVLQGTQCVAGASSIPPTIYSYTVNSDGSLSTPSSTAAYWSCIEPSGTACSATNTYPDTAVAMGRDAAGQYLFVIDQGEYPLPATCPAIAAAAANAAQALAYSGCPSISVFSAMPGQTTLTSVSQSSTYQSPLFLSKTPSALSAITYTPSGASATQELLFVTNNYDLCVVACVPQVLPHPNTVSVYTVTAGVLGEQTFSPYTIEAANPISVLSVNTNPVGQPAPGGIFVYVGTQNQNAGQLYPFQICTVVNNTTCPVQQDVTNTLLVPLATCDLQSCDLPPSAVGSNPVGMVVDPTNNFLYVVSQLSSQVFALRINASTGALTALSPANAPTGSQPVSMALHPSVNNTGQFLFTSNNASDNISGFSLDTITGSMSSLSPTIAPAAPSGMAAH
jgi:hypothetical protein